MLISTLAYSQIPSFNQSIGINSTFNTDTIINPFSNSTVTGIGISGDIVFNSDTSFVRIIVDDGSDQYMVYETYPMLETDTVFDFDYECEESCFFDNFQPIDLILQVSDASVYIENVDWSNTRVSNPINLRNIAKRNRNLEKLSSVENFIEANNLIWIAEETQFSKLYYSNKAKTWGNDYKSFGFEFYSKGFYSIFGPSISSTTNYGYVDNFDWRNRHGANNEFSPYYDGDVEGTGWITPVVCQGYGCWYNNEFICNTNQEDCNAMGGIYREAPTCWAFGPTAHVEALINLYYNEHVDEDLSEQYIVCEEGVINHGWMVSSAMNHYLNEGVPDEACLPYSASLDNCDDLCSSPSERIWIDDYTRNVNPTDEETRQYLMEYGPVTAELIYYPWGTAGHSMALVGWGVIDEDALSVNGVENPIHSSWYGTTYWVFKESSGPGVHHNGFKYIIDWENNSNIFTIDCNITSLTRNDEDVNCFDKDGDGYYFWGIGPKPDHCPPCPDVPDGDDSNPSLGPINEYGVCSIINTYTASFEKGWDNWVQIDEDDQDWWRHQGPTETTNTGPSAAQDGDFYIYTESSCNGCYPHKKYIIESPPIKLDKYCEGQVEFYYHMNTYLWGNPDYSKLELQVSFNEGLSWSSNYWSVMHDQGNEWHLVKVNFPANVNKIRFVATTGDYSFSDIALDNITIGPLQKDEQPIIINSNITWIDDNEINSDVIVENGAVLTITDCSISMHEQASIIVMQGGKLNIDNSIINCKCDYSAWQGIQVWGNSTASQLTLPGQPNAQGKLVLENGATIENAVNAVTLWKPGDWNTNGGIVVANDAHFINNRRSVEFRSFQNTHPLTGEPMGNVSHFTACHFEVNDEYSIADDPFNCHISMFEVDGINLTGNSFLNQMTEGGNTGAGIISIDANYRLVADCNSSIAPCPTEDLLPNHFEGFAYGIDASATTTKTIYVRQTDFVNNGYGIRLNSVNNATIIQNNFTVGTYGKGEWMCGTDFGIGIELAGCNNYAVEENTFTPISVLSTIPFMGIRVYNSSSLDVVPNEIYFNTFDQMNRANQADGINYVLNDENLGLNYRCNQNTGNYFDFVATGQGIAGSQSSLGYAADNTFTAISLPPSDPRHFFNDAINHVTYYYRPNMPNAQPLYVYNVTPTPFGSVPPGPCSSNYGGGNEEVNLQGLTTAQKQYFEQELTNSHTAYTGVQNLYTSLLDGGNTDEVQSEIAMAWPEDMWELRAELLGLSPLLSKDVLVSASNRTDVLPESIIFEVLSANPDELKKKELIEHLETKDNPLPAYMIEILESLTGNVTYKTILQSQMAHYGRMEGRAAGILLRDMLRDSTTTPESIRAFMAERQSLPMDMQRVDSYLESGETAQALALAASLPQQYALDGEALAEHGRFVQLKQLQAGLHDQDRNIFQLSPTEKDQLEALIEQSTGAAGRQARSILAFVYEEEFCDCPADINPELKAKTFVQPPLDKLDEAQISVHPNPAKTWVSFDYTIPGSSSNAKLEIRDATGKLVYQTTLENKQGQYVWDTRNMSSGLYHYSLKTTNGIKSGKVTVVQ